MPIKTTETDNEDKEEGTTEISDEISTTTVTITSCHDDVCSEYPVTTGVTTIIDDFTTFTTYCPLPTTESDFDENGSSKKPTDESTEQIEITTVIRTTCHANTCSSVPVITGLTTVTENNTVYTTYCPLPTSTAVTEANEGELKTDTTMMGATEIADTTTKGAGTTAAAITATSEADETKIATITGVGEETNGANTVTLASGAQGESTSSSNVPVSQLQTVAGESNQSTSPQESDVSVYEGNGARSLKMESILTVPLFLLTLII